MLILLAVVVGNARDTSRMPDLQQVMLGYEFEPVKVEIKPNSWLVPTKREAIGLGILLAASYIDGAVEGYGFDSRMAFVNNGANPYGFWGNESWRKIYVNGNPEEGVKSKFYQWFGAIDYYHLSDDLRKHGYMFGGYLVFDEIFKRQYKRKWHKWGRFIGTMALTSFVKSRGMHDIRNYAK